MKPGISGSRGGYESLSFWRISQNLEIVDQFDIPAGPWIKQHSILKELSCFSCGCACYSNMRLYGNAGKVYAHIWGEAVGQDGSGLFQLVNEDKSLRWARLNSENFSNAPIVSPDGCTIVFSNEKNQLQSVSVCLN